WDQAVAERAAEFAVRSTRPEAAGAGGAAAGGGGGLGGAKGTALTPLAKRRDDDAIGYQYVTAALDRAAGTATITVAGPEQDPPDAAAIAAAGVAFWPLAMTRELDDLILDLRTNEPELGTWILKTAGDAGRVLAYDRLLLEHSGDWLVNEIVGYLK